MIQRLASSGPPASATLTGTGSELRDAISAAVVIGFTLQVSLSGTRPALKEAGRMPQAYACSLDPLSFSGQVE